MDSVTAKRMRDEIRIYLEIEIKPTHFFTHNFGYKVTAANATKRMTTFYNALQRKAYGSNWAAQFDRPWPVAYGFLEHPNSNPHYHVLARLEPDVSMAAWAHGSQLWQRWVPSGQLDIQVVDLPKGVISYCTKRLMSDLSYGDMFVYSDSRG